ncbi:monovalent cation/H+ antiporter subunit D, partial [Pseudomonas aeruginosa]
LDHVRLFACILMLSAGPWQEFAAKPRPTYRQTTAAQLNDLNMYRQIITRGGAA